MDKSTLQQKDDSFTIEIYKKCTTNNEKLSFQDLCKENIMRRFDDLKLVCNNLIVDKMNYML